MNEKDYVTIFLKSIFPVIIVLIILAIYSHFARNEPLNDWFPTYFMVFTSLYYMSYLLIGLPLLTLLHRRGLAGRIAFILIGSLSGFMVGAFIFSFQFSTIKVLIVYLMFAFPGGLSGFYVYRLLNKKIE